MSERENEFGCPSTLMRGLAFSVLTALPIAGLVLFFEVTRPAELRAESMVASKLSDNIDSVMRSPHRFRVARFKGISAELSAPAAPVSENRIFSANDAERAFAASTGSLGVGFQSEFVTNGGRRLAVRIVSRQSLGDQIIAEPTPAMAATPASTAKLVSFVWGPWLYRAELEDRGPEAAVVVQKLL